MVGKGKSLGIGLLFALTLASAGNASAAPVTDIADAGNAVVVDSTNVTRQLSEGDSTTLFTFRLPSGAACQGDSANDNWRVQSFLVPADTDIGSLRYRASRPDGEEYRSLRYIDGNIYSMEMTNQNPGPGMPGEVAELPPMTFAWFPAGSLPPGSYKMGIACTDPSWQVERFWDVTVELESAPQVEPGGLRWQVVVPAGALPPNDSSSLSAVFVAAFAVLATATIAFVRGRIRRKRSPHQKLKESV